ncbi:MAG: hypothetical protein L0922_04555, partial [Candidatus Mariimomonas ferrooxydans]
MNHRSANKVPKSKVLKAALNPLPPHYLNHHSHPGTPHYLNHHSPPSSSTLPQPSLTPGPP